jgi:hypothetical protein
LINPCSQYTISHAAIPATSVFTPTATTVPTEGPAQPLQNATYIYDADGNLVKSVINGRSTYYLGKLYQKQVDATSTTIQKYYTSGIAQIAVRTVGLGRLIGSRHSE